MIESMGFPAYFLIVWDLISHARERGIRTGPGEGEFRRFDRRLLPADHRPRPTPLRAGLRALPQPGPPPATRHRHGLRRALPGDVIRYAAEKYGSDHVAQIVTFSTIKGKQALRDAARVLGYPYGVGDRAAKLMPPPILGREAALNMCLDPLPENADGNTRDWHANAAGLREAYATDPDIRSVADVARNLEGLRRQDSIHAAAVVISPVPLTELVPIQQKGDGAEIVTQYEMYAIEDLGLLKMDFLGLRNLSIIERTLELIESAGPVGRRPRPDRRHRQRAARRPGHLRVAALRPDDRGLPAGRFGDAGVDPEPGARPVRGRHRPRRPLPPGPMRPGCTRSTPTARTAGGGGGPPPRHGADPGAQLRHHGVPGTGAPGRPGHGRVLDGRGGEPAPRHGQEDPSGDARRRGEVRRRVPGSGTQPGAWGAAFRLIEHFAGYGFNLAHAACYGLIAYQTAWLKAHYPAEYMAAMLTATKRDKDRTAVYLNECRGMGLQVLTPDVNTSQMDFSVHDGAIRFGLSAVRNVGEGVVQRIIEERAADGPFAHFQDFIDRVDPLVLNKRTIESLIKAGAFDGMGHSRRSWSSSTSSGSKPLW